LPLEDDLHDLLDAFHDLQAKLDAASIYTDAEVENFAIAYLADKHGAISAPLKAAADRFNSRYTAAVQGGDKAAIEELDLFRKDVGSFVRLYEFLSQIVNYVDTELEKRALFLRLLLPRLTGKVGGDVIDFSTVELTHIKQARSGDLSLDLDQGETNHSPQWPGRHRHCPRPTHGAAGGSARQDQRPVRG
jgi:type I restriction enzyme R subunit